MKQVLKTLVVLALVAIVVAPLSAQEEKKKRQRGKRQTGAVAQTMNKLKAVELTAEQKEKLAALGKEYGPKFTYIKGESNVVADTLSLMPLSEEDFSEEALAGNAELRSALLARADSD